MKTIKQKIALFQRIEPDAWSRERYTCWTVYFDEDENNDDCIPDGYVRVTPYIDVEFPALDQGPIVEKQLEKLAEAEQRIRAEFQQKLNSIAETKAKLLALSYVAGCVEIGRSVDDFDAAIDHAMKT